MFNPFITLALTLALALPLSATPDRAAQAPQRPVNLNTATVTELMQLPRIGQKTAERIIAFRVGSKNSCDSTTAFENPHKQVRIFNSQCENLDQDPRTRTERS